MKLDGWVEKEHTQPETDGHGIKTTDLNFIFIIPDFAFSPI